MNQTNKKIYGLLARFDTQPELVAAAAKVRDAGYRQWDAYSPYPIDALEEAMGLRSSRLPYAIFMGGLVGGLGAFFMMSYATVVDNPFNIGGRPLFSWPTYIPITFELTVLFAATFGVLAMLAVTNFPLPYHPVFNSQDFREHASKDSFFIGIQATDPKFQLERTSELLKSIGAAQVTEVEE